MQNELPEVGRPRLLIGGSGSIDVPGLLRELGFEDPGKNSPILIDWQVVPGDIEAAASVANRQSGTRLIWIVDAATTYLSANLRHRLDADAALSRWNSETRSLLETRRKARFAIEIVERSMLTMNCEGVLRRLEERMSLGFLREGGRLANSHQGAAPTTLLELLAAGVCAEFPKTAALSEELASVSAAYPEAQSTALEALKEYQAGILPIQIERDRAIQEVANLSQINRHLAEQIYRGPRAHQVANVEPAEVAALRAKLKEAIARRVAIEKSRSWRFTAPIRKLVRMVRG